MKLMNLGIFLMMLMQEGRGFADTFEPCPSNGSPCAIMPLGDSITFGSGSSDFSGYRKELFLKALAQGKQITFVGNVESGPDRVGDKPLSTKHEGHSGYTIEYSGERQGISELVVASLEKNRPHIITLMIGTNDVSIAFDLFNAPVRLGRLIDKITQTAPNSLLVLAKIVPSQDDNVNARIQAYNSAMTRLVNDRVAEGKHIALVDMYEAFVSRSPQYKTQFLADTLHPNDAGYSVMAGVWYEAIGHLLQESE